MEEKIFEIWYESNDRNVEPSIKRLRMSTENPMDN